MKVVSYSCQRVGYFSQIHGVEGNVDPIFRRMHIEELKKINGIGPYEKTAFDCNKHVEDMGDITCAKPLVDYLSDKGVINNETQECNVICRSSVLTMLYMAWHDRSNKVSVRYEGRNIILEEIEDTKTDWNLDLSQNGEPQMLPIEEDPHLSGSLVPYHESAVIGKTTKYNSSPHNNATYAGFYADIHLTRLPDGNVDQEKEIKKSNLYVVVRHRYRYEDGTIVNIFVSKEIDAVEFNEEGEEKVSIDLKVGNFYTFANVEVLQFKSKKPLLMDFLAGGISCIHGIMWPDRHIAKITVMDRLSAVCRTSYLDEFKEKISDLFFMLAYFCKGNRFSKIELREQTNFDGGLGSKMWVVLTNRCGDSYIHKRMRKIGYPDAKEYVYDPSSPHHLIIVGSNSKRIKLENSVCHTDVVTVDNFCKRLYHSFMCKPNRIFVYGSKKELEKVRLAMTDEELTVAEFIVAK